MEVVWNPLMEIVWNPLGRKHWRNSHDAWLCFKRPKTSKSQALILQEGSHHYYTEMHVTRPGKPSASRRLDGPGPFEIKFDGAGDFCVLVRTRFLGHSRDPGIRNGAADLPHTERCATIVGPDGDETVVMQVTSELALLNPTQPLLDLEEITKLISSTPSSEIRLLPSAVPPYFRLAEASDIPTQVFYLGNAHVDPHIKPEAEFGKDAFLALSNFPNFTIPPGQPSLTTVSGINTTRPVVALPVREMRGRYYSGKPLVLQSLINNLQVKKRAPLVTASWTWVGPLNWTMVRLRWRAYDDEGEWEKDKRHQKDVSYTEYCSRNNWPILDMRGYRGWNVLITATPYLIQDPPNGDEEAVPPFSFTLAF